MSLAKRLASVTPARSNRGCVTCKWVSDLPEDDQQAWRDWIVAQRSLTQLWEIAGGMDPPLKISLGGMRQCIRAHFRAD